MTSAREQTPEARREAEMVAARVDGMPEHNSTIALHDYDPAWPTQYASIAATIREALGNCAVLLEHAGSTSVPGLPAKPIIDIVLAVPDSADESAYVPHLEARGFRLRIREPEWYEHRVLKHTNPDVNLHVFTTGCTEINRMLLFRDWVRTHPDDRDLYASEKRHLGAQTWKYVQNYADAKSAVVESILERAGWKPDPSGS
jgi:GrpB-like predicted nucleotidyltransferase (UPF0157 family)